ncbi:LCP family protein [Candidatus Gottesmanbacteria bacterium]|nr:LCP family protein [Candidatus Gottesmanbacteria bacterium]
MNFISGQDAAQRAVTIPRLRRDGRALRSRKNIPDHRIQKAIFWILFLLIFIFLIKLLWQKSIWNRANRVSIILESRTGKNAGGIKLDLFSYDPKLKQAVIMVIPDNTMLDVPFGYETYQASSVYKLGELDKKRGGGRLLAKSIENTFGIVLDGFYVFDDNIYSMLPQNKNEVMEFKKKYFSLLSLFSNLNSLLTNYHYIDTNLSLLDKLYLWNALRQLRLDQITVYDLDKVKLLTDTKLPDNTMVKIVDKDLYDAFFEGVFYDSPIRTEKITVEVVNATDQERVASQFARLMEAVGSNVIIKSTADKEEDFTCKLYLNSDKLKLSSIVAKLKTVYKCKIAIDHNDSSIHADIKVILGKGYLL